MGEQMEPPQDPRGICVMKVWAGIRGGEFNKPLNNVHSEEFQYTVDKWLQIEKSTDKIYKNLESLLKYHIKNILDYIK